MKKFLTVLLALSVVFTYTVGTAFAVTASTDEPSGDKYISEQQVLDNIDKAYNQALKNAKAEKDAALNAIFTNGKTELEVTQDTKSIVVTRTAVEKVYNDAIYDNVVKGIDQKKKDMVTAVDTAIQHVSADTANKAYNGYFTTDDTYTYEAKGYAIYDTDWEDVSKYYTKAVGTDDTDAYKALFTVGADGAVDTTTTTVNTKADAVAKAVFAEVKEAARLAVQKISLDDYSKEYNGSTQSNYDKATAVIREALNAISATVVTDAAVKVADTDANYAAEYVSAEKANWDNYAAAVARINGIYTAPVNNGSPKGLVYEAKNAAIAGYAYTADYASNAFIAKETVAYPGTAIDGLNYIAKAADLPTEAAKLEWAQNKVLTYLTTAINASLAAEKTAQNDAIVAETIKGSKGDANVIAAAKEKIALAEEAAKGAIEIATYLVNDTKDYNDLVTGDVAFTSKTVKEANWDIAGLKNASDAKGILSGTFKAAGKTYTMYAALAGGAADQAKVNGIMANIADLKEQAEIAKSAVAIDGATAVEIDEELAAAIDKVYKQTYVEELKVADIVKALYNRQNALIGKTDSTDPVKVNDRKYNTVVKWVADLDRDYDKQYKDAVRKVIKETKDNIKAATTIADAEKAFTTGYDAWDAIPTKTDKNNFQATKEYRDLQAQYTSEITNYVEYKSKNIANGTTAYDWTAATLTANLIDTLEDVYTIDELKQAYTDARAVVDGLKTKAEVKASYDAVTAKVNALPKIPTLADKETTLAVQKEVADHNEYCDTIGASQKILVSASERAVAAVQALEAKEIQDKINAILKDNKVTTDEAEAVAALRTYVDEVIASYTTENISASDLAALETRFKEADVAAIEEKLENAQVKAVETMIAKLPADGSDVAGIKAARDAYDALSRDGKMTVYQEKYYDKLADLEKLLAKHVEALKITASSKAGKGYIKVTWKVKGVAAAADGYQVYRSVKRNSGFGTKPYFTTKNQTYKNTKSLKKGTRYYYKVRAYKVVDGKKVYSDWSNKAYRIAK